MGSRNTARPRAIAVAFVWVTCLVGGCVEPGVSPDSPRPEAASVLRSARALTAGCYDFPPDDPMHIDRVETRVALEAGMAAIDFTLRDIDGAEHRLADLLATRPVVLIFGAFS